MASQFNKIFSANLGPGGRLAAWVVALGVAGAWYYYENRDNGKVFDKAEMKEWNDKKKAAFANSKKQES